MTSRCEDICQKQFRKISERTVDVGKAVFPFCVYLVVINWLRWCIMIELNDYE